MLSRPIVAALILAAAVSPASSLEALLGGAFVTLPPPAGFCELTPRYEFDGRTVAIISALLKNAGNKLLLMSADCGQLADARAGRRLLLDDVVHYQARIAEIEKPPTESITQTCTILRTQGNNAVVGDMNARLAGTIENIKTNETSFIGVLAEDNNACYAAILQKLRTEAGTEKTQVGVYAVTIIHNRSISVYRYAAYQNPGMINAMLAKLKGDVAALIAANP
jgi:hypothetical protein